MAGGDNITSFQLVKIPVPQPTRSGNTVRRRISNARKVNEEDDPSAYQIAKRLQFGYDYILQHKKN